MKKRYIYISGLAMIASLIVINNLQKKEYFENIGDNILNFESSQVEFIKFTKNSPSINADVKHRIIKDKTKIKEIIEYINNLLPYESIPLIEHNTPLESHTIYFAIEDVKNPIIIRGADYVRDKRTLLTDGLSDLWYAVIEDEELL